MAIDVTTVRLSASSIFPSVATNWGIAKGLLTSTGGNAGVVSANNLSDIPNKPVARFNMGLEIGSQVQAHSSILTLYAAGAAPSAFSLDVLNKPDLASWKTALGIPTSVGTVSSVSLNASALGFTVSGGPVTGSGTLTLGGALNIANGGTGSTTLAAFKSSLNLNSVDNTADTDKPISTFQAAAIALKSNISDLASTSVSKGTDLIGYPTDNVTATTAIAARAKSSDLAATTTGKGAELIGFKRTGTYPVSMTLQDKAQFQVDVRDYVGASWSASNEYSTEIQHAIDDCQTDGNTLIFPSNSSTVLNIVTTLDQGRAGLLGSGPLMTKLKWVGANDGGAMISRAQTNIPIKNIRLMADPGQIPSYGIDLLNTVIDWGDQLQSIYFPDCTKAGLRLGPIVNAYFHHLRFGMGRTMVEVNCNGTQSVNRILSITDATVDWTNEALTGGQLPPPMEDFIRYNNTGVVAQDVLNIVLEKWRFEGNRSSFATTAAILRAKSDYLHNRGIRLTMRDCGIDPSGATGDGKTFTFIHQDTTQTNVFLSLRLEDVYSTNMDGFYQGSLQTGNNVPTYANGRQDVLINASSGGSSEWGQKLPGNVSIGTTTVVDSANGITFSKALLKNYTAVTIASDALPTLPATEFIRLDTEASASTDNLATIPAGVHLQQITLYTSNSSRDVTIQHNVGNILLATETDVLLASVNNSITLWYNASTAKWVESGRKIAVADVSGLQSQLDTRPVTSNTNTTTTPTFTPNIATATTFSITAQAGPQTIAVPTGTPIDSQVIKFRLKDNGISRVFTFTGGVAGGFRSSVGSKMAVSGSDFVYSSVVGVISYITCVWNNSDSRWDIVSITDQPAVADVTGLQTSLDTKTNITDLASTASGKGSELVGYKIPGTGAVARIAYSKHKEFVTPEDYGALASGSSDTTNLLNAIIAVRANGLPELSIPFGKTYTLTQMSPQNMGGAVTLPETTGEFTCLVVPPNMKFVGKGGVLKNDTGILHVFVSGELSYRATVTAAMNIGDDTFTMSTSDSTNFSVGDDVLFKLDDIPVDIPETENWGFAKVKSTDTTAGTVTIDRKLTKAFTASGTNVNNKFLEKVIVGRGRNFGNLIFDGSGSTNGSRGIKFYKEIAPRIDSITARRCGSGGVVFQYTENFRVGAVFCYDNSPTGANVGKGMRCAESSGYVESLYGEYLGNGLISCEAGSTVTVGTAEDNNSVVRGESIFSANHGCSLYINRAYLRGKGGISVVGRVGTGLVRFGTMEVDYDTSPTTLPLPGRDVDDMRLTINGVAERYRAIKGYWSERTIYLQDDFSSTAFSLDGPGVVTQCMVYFGGCVAADFSSFRIGRSSSKDDAISLVPSAAIQYEVNCTSIFVPGDWWGLNAGNSAWVNRIYPPAIQMTAAASRSLTGSGKFVRIRCYIVPDDLYSSTSAIGDSSILRGQGDLPLVARKTWAPGSVAAAGTATTTLTITGAIVGDPCIAAVSASLAGWTMVSEITAANTMTVTITNTTGGALDLGSVTLRGKAFRN